MAQISEGLMNVANKKVAARKKRGGESGGDVGLAGVREKISTLNEIVCVCVCRNIEQSFEHFNKRPHILSFND